MPWELFSFVTGFLVLAEAMSISGQHRRLYWASMPNGPACAVGQHAQWASMLMGQHAQWASMPNGPACAVGQHAQWASMLMGQHAQWASMPNGPACR